MYTLLSYVISHKEHVYNILCPISRQMIWDISNMKDQKDTQTMELPLGTQRAKLLSEVGLFQTLFRAKLTIKKQPKRKYFSTVEILQTSIKFATRTGPRQTVWVRDELVHNQKQMLRDQGTRILSFEKRTAVFDVYLTDNGLEREFVEARTR